MKKISGKNRCQPRKLFPWNRNNSGPFIAKISSAKISWHFSPFPQIICKEIDVKNNRWKGAVHASGFLLHSSTKLYRTKLPLINIIDKFITHSKISFAFFSKSPCKENWTHFIAFLLDLPFFGHIILKQHL